MTRVKICGLTRPEDVDLACSLGAAYVGLNFAAVSPRRVGLETARRLAEAARPGVTRVGVFVDETHAEILEAIEAAGLDLLQIHRPLRQGEAQRLPLPVIAVACVSSHRPELLSEELLAGCRAVLFDAASRDGGGGGGMPFDWSLLEGRRWKVPVFLAGGLRAENVAEAIRRIKPFAVDVASGVEVEPRVKNHERMKRFFEAVREADGLCA